MTSDSIPPQAGPGAGAPNNMRRVEDLLELAQSLDDNRAPLPVRIAFVKRRLGEMCKELLAVEDSRERCASSDAKDAARYRWIRKSDTNLDPIFRNDIDEATMLTGEMLDRAIDAAMAAASSGTQQQESLVHPAGDEAGRTSIEAAANAPSAPLGLVERLRNGGQTDLADMAEGLRRALGDIISQTIVVERMGSPDTQDWQEKTQRIREIARTALAAPKEQQ